MTPQITPSGKKDLPRRPRTSSAKKIKPYESPSLLKRQTRDTSLPPSSLALPVSPMPLDQTSQALVETNQQNVEMKIDDPPQESLTLDQKEPEPTLPVTQKSTEKGKKKRTKSSSSSSEESESSDDSSSDSASGDDDDVDESESKNPLPNSNKEDEDTDQVMDHAEDILTQTSSKKTHELVQTNKTNSSHEAYLKHRQSLNNSGTNMLPYPAPGSLVLRTVNPLKYSYQNEFAFTCDLPYEIQLWWQINHHRHISVDDKALWAIATVLSQSIRSNQFEEVKRTLNHCINYIKIIPNVAGSRFFLVRFKTSKAKDELSNNARHDRGVFVSYQGSKKPSTVLIFQLDAITKSTPKMRSLLVTMHGLPFPLFNRLISDTIFGSIAAHKSNKLLRLKGVRELNSYPTFAYGGGRVFEVIFKRKATLEWFKLLSQPTPITAIGWNFKGAGTKDLYLLNIRHVPTCFNCGTTTYNCSHSDGCPFITIRDAIIKSLKKEIPSKIEISEDEDEDSEDSEPLASTSKAKHQVKIGKFTVRD
ncbi:uncharacterized protein MELLADRAFT_113076 [Melampsora larici-populina 98AG31]|uniref:Uncharacterized protein n=1 Tax=Melampsora larici-populina (strain 98AG31 / pathotype 3-4-7) TaxID=747676 RepID=F4S8I9_MELLP|nr:uncharacterized protein MELLADRAFT_113076 [Melampsora larici-populina 98AG31]EGF99031.1 hypothetical protein MELLADRAFT_113076 [Melampsora larici-populina 98AG31]